VIDTRKVPASGAGPDPKRCVFVCARMCMCACPRELCMCVARTLSGYSVTTNSLLIGSEGIFGVITRACACMMCVCVCKSDTCVYRSAWAIWRACECTNACEDVCV